MTVGCLKGKSAIRIHRDLLKTRGTLFGRAFWSRGYCVSTVGLEEAMIRRYIQNQEKIERARRRPVNTSWELVAGKANVESLRSRMVAYSWENWVVE